MFTAQADYRGCTIVTQAVEISATGHFVTKVEIRSSGITLNPPIVCKSFHGAAQALDWTLAKARDLLDCMVNP